MKVLLSAFACAPNTGSEPGVGWRWAVELAKQHEVVVVTDATRRSLIEPVLSQHPVPGLRVTYFRPIWLRAVPLNSWTAQSLYTAWQFALFPFAARLHRAERFDIAMHLTYGVFRHPSFLGYLGIPFVFGPLGGGEDAPLSLKRSIRGREKIKEILRSLANGLARFDPFLWAAYARTTLTLVKTEDTRRALPRPFRKRAIVYPEIGIDITASASPTSRGPNQPLKVLFAGRLLGWKGVHLAIRAVAAAMERGASIEFTLVGRGPYEAELRRVAREVGLEDRIEWIPQLPQQELFSLYRTMQCFLFPSLHDSSGNVVLEAQANGLPVICLDIGGPATLVTSETAIVVPSRNQDEDSVIRQLADAIVALATDEQRRLAMSQASLLHARSMSWASRVFGALALVGECRHER